MRRAIQRVIAAVIAATASLILFFALRDPLIGAGPKAVLILIGAVAATAPSASLLVLVAIIPIAFLGSIFSPAPFHEVESLAIAALWGGTLRVAVHVREDAIAPDFWPPFIVTAVVVACSLLVMLADVYALDPFLFAHSIRGAVTQDYLRQHDVLAAVDQGIFAIESLLLFAAAAWAARQRPDWTAAFTRMLIVGAAAAAALNVSRLMQIGLRSPTPLATVRTALHSVRINTGYGDVNAAGSYFALAEVVACGAVIATNGAARIAAICASFLVGVAAWLTGSRAAVAAAIVAVAILFAGRLRLPRSRQLAVYGLGSCGVAALVFLTLFPNPFTGPDARFSVMVRLEMARIALRMFSAHPFFGVGIGGFYSDSAQYLAAGPLRHYYSRENAHNNFLQLIAELGLAGMLAGGWLAARVAVRWRESNRMLGENDRRLLHSLTMANTAFLGTMLLGHPLLTPAVSFIFALSSGAMAGTGPEGSSSRRANAAAIVAIAVLLLLLPFRIHDRVRHADMEHVGWGVGGWESDSSGEKMRRPQAHATLFVPPASRWIELPCRLATPGTPVRFAVSFRGHRADDLIVTSTTLSRYRLVIAQTQDRSDVFEPLELTLITGDSGNVLLGKLTAH